MLAFSTPGLCHGKNINLGCIQASCLQPLYLPTLTLALRMVSQADESEKVIQSVQEIGTSDLEIKQLELSLRILIICLVPSRPYEIDRFLRMRRHSVEYATIKRYLDNLLRHKLIRIVKDDEKARDEHRIFEELNRGGPIDIGNPDVTLKDRLGSIVGRKRHHVNPLYATTKRGQDAIRLYAGVLQILKGKPFRY